MGVYKYLMIHCTATVVGTSLTPESIERMHMGAKNLPDGRVKYKGKKYASKKSLPNDKIGSVPANLTNGRGWAKVGYSRIFFEDGSIHEFVKHNEDNWISSDELTYGAVGFNSVTKHFVYAGGLAKQFELRNGRKKHFFENTMSTAQEWELRNAIMQEIKNHPEIKIIGHNQTAVKGCPCFDIRDWADIMGIPKENVDQRSLKVRLRGNKRKTPAITKPFADRTAGDKFRNWINDNHSSYAKEISLDRSGSHTNSYIKKAFAKFGYEYSSK